MTTDVVSGRLRPRLLASVTLRMALSRIANVALSLKLADKATPAAAALLHDRRGWQLWLDLHFLHCPVSLTFV